MFLDDQLIQICRDAKVDTPVEFNRLNGILIETCQNYYKSKIKLGMKYNEVRTILDRTFKLWDSFIRMAENSDDTKLQMLSKLFAKYNFKLQFFLDDRLREFYNKL